MRADLHIHTTFSDGELTPAQAAQKAFEAGLDAFAVTDHDECRGCAAVEAPAGITAVSGIELAAHMDGEVHVLGYGINCGSKALLSYVRSAAESRFERAAEIVWRLSRDGFDIGMDEVQNAAGGRVIGRPHIAAVLQNKGYAASVSEAFERYLSSAAPYYVPQKKLTVERAAALILEAGGWPVLAHPGLLSGAVFGFLLPRLAAMGFWGVEAYHPAHTDGQCAEFESLARLHGLFVTSGSDYHGSFTPRVGIGQETRGSRYLSESLLNIINASEKRTS